MPRNQPAPTLPDSSAKTYQEDIQRLENQVGQLISIIANLNERLNYLESIQTNPFLLPRHSK